MAANPIFHASTKHIVLDYHFVRERVQLGLTRSNLYHQPADVLTKGLSKARFYLLSSETCLSKTAKFEGMFPLGIILCLNFLILYL